MLNTIQILLITQHVPHYRIPIFNMINDRVNLTILHNQKNIDLHSCEFNQIYCNLGSIGPMLYFKEGISNYCNKYDVIIAESNLRFIDRNLLVLKFWKKYKWIFWGIGQAASYKKRLGSRDLLKYIRFYLNKKVDAAILYSDFPLRSYIDAGINPSKIFIAHNTVVVDDLVKHADNKNTLLFVGTLYKQKKVEELISSYAKAVNKTGLAIPLIIIGDGEEREALESLVERLHIGKLITFKGALVDSLELSTYYSKALACISPGQAGLTVLSSMANSVPFITRKDAITGGEIFNINMGKNSTGVVYTKSHELVDLLCDINSNRQKYVEMGQSARKYYLTYRSPKNMVDSIIKAINYVSEDPKKVTQNHE